MQLLCLGDVLVGMFTLNVGFLSKGLQFKNAKAKEKTQTKPVDAQCSNSTVVKRQRSDPVLCSSGKNEDNFPSRGLIREWSTPCFAGFGLTLPSLRQNFLRKESTCLMMAAVLKAPFFCQENFKLPKWEEQFKFLSHCSQGFWKKTSLWRCCTHGGWCFVKNVHLFIYFLLTSTEVWNGIINFYWSEEWNSWSERSHEVAFFGTKDAEKKRMTLSIFQRLNRQKTWLKKVHSLAASPQSLVLTKGRIFKIFIWRPKLRKWITTMGPWKQGRETQNTRGTTHQGWRKLLIVIILAL